MGSNVDADNQHGTTSSLRQMSPPHGILVVDNDESIRKMLENWLGNRGYQVWLAPSGVEAIDLYRQHRGAIRIVLMDVNMAGMDGPETLAALRELDPHICCCFMSEHDGIYGSRLDRRWGEEGHAETVSAVRHLRGVTDGCTTCTAGERA
jgi:CheY-like chemotaxis protein